MGDFDEIISEVGVQEFVDHYHGISSRQDGKRKLSKKAARHRACWTLLHGYAWGLISEENFVACSEYMGVSKDDIDLNLIREIKTLTEKELEYIEKHQPITRKEHQKIQALYSKYYKNVKCEGEDL